MNLYRSILRKNTVVIPVTSITLNKESVENYKGGISQVKVTVTPSDATHKDDYVVSIGDYEYPDRIGTTFSKDGDTIYVNFDGTDDYDNWVNTNYSGGYPIYRWITKDIPVTVSVDGITATFNITMRPSGSYLCNGDQEGSMTALGFEVIKSSSNVTLMAQIASNRTGVLGNNSLNDSSSQYRTSIDNYFGNHLSVQLNNKFLSFSKVVHSTLTASTSYSSKFHLLAANEVKATLSSEDISAGSSILTLGSDNYSYIISEEQLLPIPAYTLSRTIAREEYSGSYRGVRLEIEDTSINTSGGLSWAETISDTEKYHYLLPLVNLPSNTKVVSLGQYLGRSCFRIDFSGQSTIQLSSVPLGSLIYDTDGVRNGDMDLFIDDSRTINNNIDVGVGATKTIKMEMFAYNDDVNQTFTVNLSNAHVTASVNNDQITFTGVSNGNTMATITNQSGNVTKRYDLVVNVR